MAVARSIGSKVRIIADLNTRTSYDGYGVTNGMVESAGCMYTIISVFQNKYGPGYVYKLKDMCWNWTDSMLEDVIIRKEISETNRDKMIDDSLFFLDLLKGDVL